jgi:hypothetical protein
MKVYINPAINHWKANLHDQPTVVEGDYQNCRIFGAGNNPTDS